PPDKSRRRTRPPPGHGKTARPLQIVPSWFWPEVTRGWFESPGPSRRKEAVAIGAALDLHELQVVVFRSVDVRNRAAGEHLAQMDDLRPNGADRPVTEHGQDFLRRYVIVALVQRVGDLDLHVEIGQLRLDDTRDFNDLEVLESEVERPPVDERGADFHQDAVEVDHVRHANVRPALLAAMDGDDAFADRVGGELVHRKVKALARRPAADG